MNTVKTVYLKPQDIAATLRAIAADPRNMILGVHQEVLKNLAQLVEDYTEELA